MNSFYFVDPQLFKKIILQMCELFCELDPFLTIFSFKCLAGDMVAIAKCRLRTGDFPTMLKTSTVHSFISNSTSISSLISCVVATDS